jgi:hypothetical protein
MGEKYTKFKNHIMNKKIVDLKKLGKYTIVEAIQFIVNLLVFPAIAFQMYKTWQIKETKDFNPFFILLQFFGGAPEGMIGLIIGILSKNTQMMSIGIYAMFYQLYMLFFRLFGKRGLYKSLF